MDNKQRILIVDDDENIAELISLYLIKECFDTKIVYDGESAINEVTTYKPDLILLDVMLPGIDGYEACAEIRKTSQVPIIMVSAKGEVFDKVLGLKMGADDYIVKPFDANELSARVSAVLRRSQVAPSTPAAETGDYISYDKLIVNITNYTVTYNGENIELPPKELELLYFIASSPNQVFTRDQLLDSVWGYDFSGDSRTVDVHIKRLREKFTNEDTNWSIATVWGVGYKFEVR